MPPYALANGVDPGNFRNIFNVSFLNQTLLQIENYVKMDNLPPSAMFRYVLIFSERKWLYLIICLNNFMIVKHEFGYFKTCICFRTEATTRYDSVK